MILTKVGAEKPSGRALARVSDPPMDWVGFEPTTHGLKGRCSDQAELPVRTPAASGRKHKGCANRILRRLTSAGGRLRRLGGAAEERSAFYRSVPCDSLLTLHEVPP